MLHSCIIFQFFILILFFYFICFLTSVYIFQCAENFKSEESGGEFIHLSLFIVLPTFLQLEYRIYSRVNIFLKSVYIGIFQHHPRVMAATTQSYFCRNTRQLDVSGRRDAICVCIYIHTHTQMNKVFGVAQEHSVNVGACRARAQARNFQRTSVVCDKQKMCVYISCVILQWEKMKSRAWTFVVSLAG